MQIRDCVMGIDTSNYMTSVAVINSAGEIMYDLRKPLKVKQGQRGLRQSHALFQHIETLPVLIEEALSEVRKRLSAVSVSVRPRPLEDSYMPVFKAGWSMASALGTAMNLPVYSFSHQEGHIEAVKRFSTFRKKEKFLCFHLSGGTCELLLVSGNKIERLGGSRDISFGQVLDRIGVKLGMDFPCGQEFDRISLKAKESSNKLKEIPVTGTWINLSGIETQAERIIDNGLTENERDMLIKEIFNKIYDSIFALSGNAVISTGLTDILFTGGVSSSRFLADALHSRFDSTNVSIDFGNQHLASDNAVGTAFLGGKMIWQ